MPWTARRRRLGVHGAAVLVVATLLGLPGPGATAASDEPVEPAPAVPVEPPSADGVLQLPVVVAGIGGLGWDDVSPVRTPALWALLADGASAAAVTIHTTGQPACADGGWLSLSAGRAVAGRRFAGSCLGLPAVEAVGEGGRVSSWQRYVVDQLDSTYDARLGTLGPTLARSGSCVTAVGPGAALALAERNGTVTRYRPALSTDAFDCPITIVDLGPTSRLEELDDGQLDADAALAELVEAIPPGTDLLVTSVAAPLGVRLQMGVLVLASDDLPASLLSSPSTRRPGVVRLLDLPSTLVDLLGLPEPAELQGAPLLVTDALGDRASTVESLADITVADQGLRAATNPLLNTTGAAALLLILLALFTGRRWSGTAPRRALRAAFLVLAAVPVAAYLVTLTRWWEFADPRTALWLGIGAIAVVLAAAVLTLPRQPIWRPVLALASITSAVLVLDAVTGARLHWASPLGTSPVLGNRYYGFGNTTYAVFAVHAIVLAGILATRYNAAGRRRAATLTVVAVGLVAVAVDTWPTWGADVGGGLALVPAFGLLALSVSGRRPTASRVVASLVAGVAVVGGVAWLDWLRAPSERSHAGRFVQQVIDGDAWDLLARKLGNAAASFERGTEVWLTVAVLVWATLALARPQRFGPPSLTAAMTQWPLLRSTLAAVLVSAVVGSFVNDWGVRIATVVLTAALPVIAVVCLSAGAQRRRIDRAVPRSPIATTPASNVSATTDAAIAPSRAVPKEASAKT